MRHADAEPGHPGQRDVQRRLTSAGRDRAVAQAPVITAHAPQLVLCSAATRATETLSHLDVGAAAVLVEPELYGASATAVLLRLTQVPDDVGSVLLIGHMPTVGEIAVALLADPATGGSPSDGDRLRSRGFSPGAVAVLELPDPWADLQPSSGHLRHFG